MTPKLTQISRISEKSLLCNVSMNTCLDDQASRVGSVISVGTLPLRRTTQWCVTLQKTQRKHQRVRKCPLKHLNPTRRCVREDTFIEHRNSKAYRLFEIRKWQDNFGVHSSRLFKKSKAKIIFYTADIRNIMGAAICCKWEVWFFKNKRVFSLQKG